MRGHGQLGDMRRQAIAVASARMSLSGFVNDLFAPGE
jgi:hypothetical protein